MHHGKYETYVCFGLFLFAMSFPVRSAVGQQSTDSGTDSILTGQPYTGQTSSNPLQSSPAQPLRLPLEDQRPSSGANLQTIEDQNRAAQNGNIQDGKNYDGKTSAASSSRDLNRLPPDPPTEFQRLVQSSTGQMLPLYGARLFRDAPSTFAPLDRVPVPLDYVIGPGDELLIQVWGQVSLNSRFTVDRVGDIYIPQVGTMRVAGLPFAQVQSYLKAQMGKVFRNFDLNVNMGQLRSIQIFVVGQARRPGSYTISSLSTLVDALFVTGGPTPQGSLRHVQLKRSGKVVVDFDLYDLLERGDKSKDAPLLPGDVIYIPPAGLQVAVAGSVNTPAIYELKTGDGSTVAEALALASGPTNVASDALARLERVDAHSMRSVTDLALDQTGLATALKDGDILELVAVSDRFRNGVTLNGNVANPGRYSWKPGMRVGDLFPDKDALITRDYWLQRERLGQPTLTYAPSLNTPSLNNPSPSNQQPSNQQPNDQQPKGQNGLAVIPAADSDAQSSGSAHSSAAATMSRPAGGFLPRNNVVLSAPEIDWSYAVIERQDPNTLTTSLLPFNLGHLVMEKDSSQNIELQPNDVVTIFSKADIRVPQVQQTKFVRLEGEFLSSGVYSVLPNETLAHLIQRAGGLSSDAYLYGSEFTRESTRRVQQQRLDEYIDQLSLRSGINAANTSGRTVSTIDTAASAALLTQNQNIISSLRQARAGGRIVLHLQPDTVAISQLPALSLENGDTFIVPHRPATVNATGALYNPNTFVFEQGRKLRYYLGLAGGPNRDADRKRAYVIRADGSVISKQQMSSIRGNAFESLPIYPGDTIIVPLNLNKGATLRNVVDIAQIFGQFGIALAAANVIF